MPDTQPEAASKAVPDESAERPVRSARNSPIRSWPLLVLALPAAVAVWSGWVGIGQMTGLGVVRPLPGIVDSVRINTVMTLPLRVEAYAAYALRAWLTPDPWVTRRTRQFARKSAIGSLLLGMAGQVAYHLLAQSGTVRAPWEVTTLVSCLPVLVLGMGAALAHMLHTDARLAGVRSADPVSVPVSSPVPDNRPAQVQDGPGGPVAETRVVRLAEAQAFAVHLAIAGQRISRRTLGAAGLRGSNAELGELARRFKPGRTSGAGFAT
jgi:hypothetical protein